jgi:YD repeat-containing protein
MRLKTSLFSLALFYAFGAAAQNVGINADGSAPDPSAALHIKSNTKGLLIPTMTAAERTGISNPASGLMVYQTDGTAGFYYNSGTPSIPVWTYINPSGANTAVTYNANGSLSVIDGAGTQTSAGRAWLAGGNHFGTTGSAYNFGTISNDHVNLATNNTVQGRLTSSGEFFIGATSAPVPGDRSSFVSSATSPFALTGYSSFNGSGIYGMIRGANTTQFAAVQGEYASTSGNFNSSGVRGINTSPAPGTGFRITASAGPKAGVIGNVSGTGAYAFGVHGTSPSTTPRSGGVFGDNASFSMGALGYFASNSVDYSVYGFGKAFETGVAGGRENPSGPTANAHIGLGIYGGVMGGWIRGSVYGAHVMGERYSLYVDGQTYTNKPITQLVETQSGERLPTYTSTSLKTDITARGRSVLENGSRYISFDAAFKEMISANPDEMTITVTPNGNSNGVYVASYDANGFWVKENNSGKSNVSFNWIAISTRRGYEEPEVSAELLDRNFDSNVRSVMHHELDPKQGKPMWWDGTRVRYDNPPSKKPDPDISTGERPKNDKPTNQ